MTGLALIKLSFPVLLENTELMSLCLFAFQQLVSWWSDMFLGSWCQTAGLTQWETSLPSCNMLSSALYCMITGCLAWLQMARVFPPASQAFCLMIYHISCFDTVRIRCSARHRAAPGGPCFVTQPYRGSALIAVEWLSRPTVNLIRSAPCFFVVHPKLLLCYFLNSALSDRLCENKFLLKKHELNMYSNLNFWWLMQHPTSAAYSNSITATVFPLHGMATPLAFGTRSLFSVSFSLQIIPSQWRWDYQMIAQAVLIPTVWHINVLSRLLTYITNA